MLVHDEMLIPTHVAYCEADGTATGLVEGPQGRCLCDALTTWLECTTGLYVCRGCQAEFDWLPPVTLEWLALIPEAVLDASLS